MQSAGSGAVQIALGGVAVKCCVHDRTKSEVTTEKQVVELGLEVGMRLIPGVDFIHLCSCCDNLFVAPQQEPLYCNACRGPLVHPLAGPLAPPKGVVS